MNGRIALIKQASRGCEARSLHDCEGALEVFHSAENFVNALEVAQFNPASVVSLSNVVPAKPASACYNCGIFYLTETLGEMHIGDCMNKFDARVHDQVYTMPFYMGLL